MPVAWEIPAQMPARTRPSDERRMWRRLVMGRGVRGDDGRGDRRDRRTAAVGRRGAGAGAQWACRQRPQWAWAGAASPWREVRRLRSGRVAGSVDSGIPR